MANDFGYVNARVRGMKARLLGDDAYRAALEASDFGAFRALLAHSPYGGALERTADAGRGLAGVDRALAEAFHADAERLLAYAGGDAKRMIAALLRRYDLEDLKTVARAVHAGRDLGDVGDALQGAGELRPKTLEAVAAAPDLPSAAQVVAATGHPLGSAFVRAARTYAQDGDLLAFEVALDGAFFASLTETAKAVGAPAFDAYVARTVDAANLRTALKIAGRDVDADALFLPGGRDVGRDAFDALAGGGLSALAQVKLGAFASVATANDVSGVERAIRAVQEREARRAAIRDPLGIGVVVRYLRDREEEGATLRLLARASYYGVPRAHVEKELGHA
jgi:V/A-type H+-transporting ATPase subunit C